MTPTGHDGILAHLDRFQLSGALVGAMESWLHDPMVGNREASALAGRLSERGVVACWVAVPPTPEELDSFPGFVSRAADAGVAAVRLYPRSHGFIATDPVMDDLYIGLIERNLPLCLNRTELEWREIEDIARRFPALNVIISQIGYRELRVLSIALTRQANLHVDLVNFSAHEALEWLIANFGDHRVLFATGSGVRDPGEGVFRLTASGLDQRVITRIGRRNSERLFGLDMPEQDQATTDHLHWAGAAS